MPHCMRCGKETTRDTIRCRSCAMRDRWRDPTERENFTNHNKNNLKNNWENPNFRQMHSILCKKRSVELTSSRDNIESRSKISQRVKESWKRDHKTRSEINRATLKKISHKSTEGEDYVAKRLDSLGIKYIRQYEVLRTSLGLSGPGRGKILDFYLPSYNLDIEVDGSSHSSMMGKSTNDRERDLLLTSNGYIVHRIIDDGHNENLDSSLTKILGEIIYGD